MAYTDDYYHYLLYLERLLKRLCSNDNDLTELEIRMYDIELLKIQIKYVRKLVRYGSAGARINSICTRLSRYKYISPFELLQIADKICYQHDKQLRHHATLKSAFPNRQHYEGMLRGESPFYGYDVHWEDKEKFNSMVVSKEMRGVKKHFLELEILIIILKSKKQQNHKKYEDEIYNDNCSVCPICNSKIDFFFFFKKARNINYKIRPSEKML